MNEIRIGIIFDHPLIAESIGCILEKHEGLTCSVININPNDFHFMGVTDDIDVYLLELDHPQDNGLLVMEWLTKHNPDCKIIVISTFHQPLITRRCIQCGIKGYLNHQINCDELKNAIVAVYNGEVYYTKTTMPLVVKSVHLYPVEFNTIDIRICKLISLGKTTKQIAEQLNISQKWLDKRKSELMAKTKTKNATALISYCFKNGILSIA